MLTREMAEKKLQATIPAQWSMMSEDERQQAILGAMETIETAENSYLTSMPPTQMSGDLLADLQKMNGWRLLAQEMSQSDINSEIETAAPIAAVAYWTFWTKQNPGAEPLIEAMVSLWDQYTRAWEETYQRDFNPTHRMDPEGWESFPWMEHLPIGNEMVDRESLKETILSYATRILLAEATTATQAVNRSFIPGTNTPADRSSMSWEELTDTLEDTPLILPPSLLPEEESNQIWVDLISQWEMDIEDPQWGGFETVFPEWMATWLKHHPDHWLNDTWNWQTRQPQGDPQFQEALAEHLEWSKTNV